MSVENDPYGKDWYVDIPKHLLPEHAKTPMIIEEVLSAQRASHSDHFHYHFYISASLLDTNQVKNVFIEVVSRKKDVLPISKVLFCDVVEPDELELGPRCNYCPRWVLHPKGVRRLTLPPPTDFDYMSHISGLRPKMGSLWTSYTTKNVERFMKDRRPLKFMESCVIPDKCREIVQKPKFDIREPQYFGLPSLFRKVISIWINPSLLYSSEKDEGLSSSDAKSRACELLYYIPDRSTALTIFSKGSNHLLKTIAAGIEARDGLPSNSNAIFLTDGLSHGVKMIMEVLLRAMNGNGILCPIPHDPLYSDSISLYGGILVPYYLRETTGWDVRIKHLKTQLKAAKRKGIRVIALIVINPGNPTGQVLEVETQMRIVDFCLKENLILIADEVNQDIIYAGGKKFMSFKKAASQTVDIEGFILHLVSLHSVTGVYEGGIEKHGGYMEVSDPILQSLLGNLISKQDYRMSCSNLTEIVLASLVISPPKVGDGCYRMFLYEKVVFLRGLALRAETAHRFFNSLEGVSCKKPDAGLFVYLRLSLPKKARKIAKARSTNPDLFYADEVLRHTSIEVVPGSDFGQIPGTWHVVCSIKNEINDLARARVKDLHQTFMHEYRDS